LQRALHLFSHDNVELHDVEMNLGIDKALCLKLGYVVVTTQSICISKEVVLICKCLREILKCSSTNRLRSFRHVGATELLPLLIQLWTSIIQSKIERESRSSEFDDGLISIVRVLRVYSKLIPAKSYLINYLQGAFLGQLLRDMLLWINEPSSSILYSSTAVLWETLGLVKDLTFRLRIDDKKILMFLEGEILFSIISASFERIKGFHPRFQEWCTAVIWNLVLDPPICQNLLSKTIGDGKQVGNVIVEGLLQVLIQHSTSGKNSGLSLKIKRNATSALGNIISDSKNHTFLFQNRCGTKLSALIPQLVCSAQEDSDPVIRRRAMRTIRCLAGSMDIGAKCFVHNGDLPSFLIDIISQKGMHEDENYHDMLIQACQTVIALKESINVEVWSQLQIALLQRIENTTCTNIIPAAVLCLSTCMSKNPIARSPSCFSIKFWNNLERLVSTSSKVHDAVSGLLVAIAKMEKLSGSIEAQELENPSILTKTPVINTLTTILLESEFGKEHARNQALEVILILSENGSNKRPLAGNERLLSGLVTLCLMKPDSEIKDSAKIIILQLVPEI
jgi:hypothetical protein